MLLRSISLAVIAALPCGAAVAAEDIRLAMNPFTVQSAAGVDRQPRRVLSQLPYEVWRLADQTRREGQCAIDVVRAEVTAMARVPANGILQESKSAARPKAEPVARKPTVEVVDGRINADKSEMHWSLRLKSASSGKTLSDLKGSGPTGDPIGLAERIAKDLVTHLCRG